MNPGLIGKKIGMTRIFTDDGRSRAVTVVEAVANRIVQIKTAEIDGYDAIQVTLGTRRQTRVSKAMQGHFAKTNCAPGRVVRELRLTEPIELQKTDAHSSTNEPQKPQPENSSNEQDSNKPDVKLTELNVDQFSAGQKVDVTGRTIGKGFAGVIKRHGFRGGRATHGNSKAHRLGGSIGNAQDPGRVFKGKKMAGHMGAVRRVQQGLEIIRVDKVRNLLLISGSIPGPRGADVMIRPSVKTNKQAA